MQVGIARGREVLPLKNGHWAWRVWDHRRSLSGTAETEMQAQEAADRALEQLVAEARAASPHERELPIRAPRSDRDPEA